MSLSESRSSDPSEPESPPPPRFRGLVARTVRRRWPQILTQWGILATALTSAAYLITRLEYEGTALIRVAPPQVLALGNTLEDGHTRKTWLETQKILLTSTEILSHTLTDPQIPAAMPELAKSNDPVGLLRQQITIEVLPGTDLLSVSMTDHHPDTPSVVVNTLVKNYVDLARSIAGQSGPQGHNVSVVSLSQTPQFPRSGARRTVLMTAAPVVSLAIVLGLFLIVEARASRQVLSRLEHRI